MELPTIQTREEFLARRATSIGGSEISSVVGKGRFACARRLFFIKTSQTPDFPDVRGYRLDRGLFLEDKAAEMYEKKTGRKTAPVPFARSKTHPNCSVNADRVIYRDGKPGYLELKVVDSTFPYTRKGGVPDEYILQVHYGCAVLGWEWGAFGVYAPMKHDSLEIDFEADKELGAALLDAAQNFWDNHVVKKIAPPPLPAGSKPCEDCIFRATCPAFDSDEIIL